MSTNTQRLKVLLYFCIILVTISGIAGADKNIIVGFKNKTVGSNEDNIIRNHGGVVKKNFHLIPVIVASINESKIYGLKIDPNIAYVEDDKIYNATDEYTSSWGVKRIGSKMVHDQGITGTGAKVAVLDTGIDYNHTDLKDNYKGGYNFVVNNTNPWDDNCLTQAVTCHGTHVSGIVAAEKNGIGVVGVVPNASLYALKVLGPDGSGFESYIIAGLQWAVDNKMNIATMSFGSSEDSQALHDAIDKAYNSGILLVAAAGNTGGFVLFPAAYDSVIAVSATDSSDDNASFSANGTKIELAAPGVDIYSTILNNSYGYRSGTSMAAPHVAGVAALIYSTNFPDVNGDGVKNNTDVRLILQKTAKDLGIPGRDNFYGYGLVDAQNATLGIPTVWAPDPINLQNDSGKFWVNYSWQPGIGIITDSYKVIINGTWYNGTNNFRNITTVPGGWINITVWAYNSSGNGILSMGSISQNTQVQDDIIQLLLNRTTGPEIKDAKNASLVQGNYSIKIKNINLTKIDMNIYENGTIIKNLSKTFLFYKSNNVEFNIDVKSTFKIVFIPYGRKGTLGYVTIKRNYLAQK